MTELCPNQGEHSTAKLALHPDGTPMISIGPAVDLSEPSPALDPEHSRRCMGEPPPAAGEVAELVAALRDPYIAPLLRERTRAAELLERWQPQPVPVAVLYVERFRGSAAMENVQFELTADLPPGRYELAALPLPSRETPESKGSESPLSEFGPNDMPLG